MYRNFFCIESYGWKHLIAMDNITRSNLLDHRRQFSVESNNKGSPVTATPSRMVIQSSSCIVTLLQTLPFVSGRSSKSKQFRRSAKRKRMYRTIFHLFYSFELLNKSQFFVSVKCNDCHNEDRWIKRWWVYL